MWIFETRSNQNDRFEPNEVFCFFFADIGDYGIWIRNRNNRANEGPASFSPTWKWTLEIQSLNVRLFSRSVKGFKDFWRALHCWSPALRVFKQRAHTRKFSIEKHRSKPHFSRERVKVVRVSDPFKKILFNYSNSPAKFMLTTWNPWWYLRRLFSCLKVRCLIDLHLLVWSLLYHFQITRALWPNWSEAGALIEKNCIAPRTPFTHNKRIEPAVHLMAASLGPFGEHFQVRTEVLNQSGLLIAVPFITSNIIWPFWENHLPSIVARNWILN